MLTLVLEITSSNMKGIKVAINVFRLSLPDVLSDSLHDTCRGTLNFILIPHMISHKALHPQIMLPILKVKEGIEMNQQSSVQFVVCGHVDALLLLDDIVVDT